jgi:serine/threonine protein kinase
MGEVYQAEDLVLGTEVALKAIRREVAARDSMMERFRRETLLARRVTHPNVCRIFDLGPAFVFRMRRGRDLPDDGAAERGDAPTMPEQTGSLLRR